MKVEQTGVDAVKITLENDLEKQTIGKAEALTITIEQQSTMGFRGAAEIKTVKVEKT